MALEFGIILTKNCLNSKNDQTPFGIKMYFVIPGFMQYEKDQIQGLLRTFKDQLYKNQGPLQPVFKTKTVIFEKK